MRFLLFNPVHFEKWWAPNRDIGIGGSETSAICMGESLAERGHEVINYVPLPDDVPSGTKACGSEWRRLEDVDWSLPGVWVLYRCPQDLDNFDLSRTDQVRYVLLQDWDQPQWTPERVAAAHRIIPLCHAHERWLLQRRPEFKGKTWVTRNGIRGTLLAEVEAEGPVERNPKRIMFASSPDRGLHTALKIAKRVKEFVPDLDFHATYGFNNIDKLIAQGSTHFKKIKDECLSLVDEIGATFHGRLTQRQLYREWRKTGIWTYITSFWETGPCHGDTLVETLGGPVPIRDLVGREPFHVYSCDANGDLSVSVAHNATLKRKDATVVRVTFKPGIGRNANKEVSLTLTPDHEVMLVDGTYKPAGSLRIGERVKAFHQHPNGWGRGYAKVGVTERPLTPAHRFVAEKTQRPLADGEVVDHTDGNTRNNTPGNLVIQPSQSDHAADHFRRMSPAEAAERSGRLSVGMRKFQDSIPADRLAELRGRAARGLWAKVGEMSSEDREAFIRKRIEAVSEEGWRNRRAATAKMNRERFAKAPWRDRDRMFDLYVTRGMSPEKMADELGCTFQNVYIWLKKLEISREATCSNHVVVSVEPAGSADVYCMQADPDHNFVANGIFVHNCITGLEAMSLGAIPIFTPIWAQGENLDFGVAIVGSPDDEGTIARAAAEVVRMATDANLQERIRVPMMESTRGKWDWSQFAWRKPGENWEQAAEEDLAKLANRTFAAPATAIPGLCDNPDEFAARTRWLSLAPGDVMLDVGCADGSWSIPAAKMGATVYALDANQSVRILDAIRDHGVADRVHFANQFVGNERDNRLDWFVAQRGLDRVDYVKIDVEGHELAVLEGAVCLIKRFRPRLFIEVHTETVENVCVQPEQVCTLFDNYQLPYEFEIKKVRTNGGGLYHFMFGKPTEVVA